MGDEVCGVIAKIKSLIVLRLSDYNIGPAGAYHLAQLKSLQILNIGKYLIKKDKNKIGDEGARKLSTMLSLRKLSLSNKQLMQPKTRSEHKEWLLCADLQV
jgi:hypothetical protein